METREIPQVIQEAKKIKFADLKNNKGGTSSTAVFVVDEENNVNGWTHYTTGANVNKDIKNPHLRNMYVISCGSSTDDETFKKRYLR